MQNIDMNKLINFALHWTCAGIWLSLGFFLAGILSHYIPALPHT
jgi:uncharacterized membrane protein YccF (DUF307 family)